MIGSPSRPRAAEFHAAPASTRVAFASRCTHRCHVTVAPRWRPDGWRLQEAVRAAPFSASPRGELGRRQKDGPGEAAPARRRRRGRRGGGGHRTAPRRPPRAHPLPPVALPRPVHVRTHDGRGRLCPPTSSSCCCSVLVHVVMWIGFPLLCCFAVPSSGLGEWAAGGAGRWSGRWRRGGGWASRASAPATTPPRASSAPPSTSATSTCEFTGPRAPSLSPPTAGRPDGGSFAENSILYFFLTLSPRSWSSRSCWGCHITDEGLIKISSADCVANLTSISLWGLAGITDKGVVHLVRTGSFRLACRCRLFTIFSDY